MLGQRDQFCKTKGNKFLDLKKRAKQLNYFTVEPDTKKLNKEAYGKPLCFCQYIQRLHR